MYKIRKFLTALLILLLAWPNLALRADEENPAPPALGAGLALVACAMSGHIIHAHGDPHQRAYPASMTKVMTALLLLESGAAMDDIIFHSHDAIFGFNRNSTHIYMSPGEGLTVSQALYAIMVRSANDVSNGIAEFVAGDLESFAEMMTTRAHELGAVNTNFTNAHGLNHPGHYTTPFDMYLIMREAIKHEKFLEVASTPRFVIPPTQFQHEPRIIDNTNLMVRPTSPHFTLDIMGGKTGWTTPSGHTLVSYGRRDDIGLISVIMAATARDMIFNDTRNLMNYAFEQFEEHEFFAAEDFSANIDLVQRGREGVIVIDSLPVVAERDIALNLPVGLDFAALNLEIVLPDRISAPSPANFNVGRVALTYNEQILDTIGLRTAAAGLPLSAADLEALIPEPPPQPAGLFDNLHEYFYLPSWLYSPGPFTYSLAAILALIILFVTVKFLKFAKNKKRRGRIKTYSSKAFKAHIAKNYKYR
ncbi:MAG: hypothetical protein LBE35_04840 [Clostridiales bacterium]|jgi:D-alanyl-D-alanine carboxypeptidase|nr:hypothetical protein [Clostridiales bacterium]